MEGNGGGRNRSVPCIWTKLVPNHFQNFQINLQLSVHINNIFNYLFSSNKTMKVYIFLTG